ncbi:MAG: ABC transporter ATP-binding protein [Peptidiphaga gingivicola]
MEFKNVSFRYPDAEDDALKEISFTAEPGQTVAVIGSTGSGKSSIVNLIPRFYDVREGQVLLDGRDVREWTQEALRNRISLVPQKATLFSGTIASNIDYGKGSKELTPADVVEAARVANASEFIATKEDDYASAVAQGGSNFSGGQKQRLSIARAVARDGEVMIFDDSFSALDYKTDRDVRAALREAAAGATIIIVAQRIGTVRNADKILVVDKGRIVGAGTHDELFANNPVYREIALSQLSEEELA